MRIPNSSGMESLIIFAAGVVVGATVAVVCSEVSMEFCFPSDDKENEKGEEGQADNS